MKSKSFTNKQTTKLAASSLTEFFNTMSPALHRAMKLQLLKLAEGGAPRPKANTIEGYALRQYTTQPNGKMV
jgi:hypothetical protein